MANLTGILVNPIGDVMENKRLSAYNVAVTGTLLAMVILLQTVLGSINLGFAELSFVLVPIVLGAMVCGVWTGAFLGFAFGVIVLITGITGANQFTHVLFADHPVLTSLTCIVKGAAAGAAAGAAYNLLKSKNEKAATIVAAIVAPTVNTGLFILGALTMSGTIAANFAGGNSVIYFLIIGCAGWNYVIEAAVNLILAPSLYFVLKAVKNKTER